MLVVVRTADDAAAAVAGGADQLVVRQSPGSTGTNRSAVREIVEAAADGCRIALWWPQSMPEDGGGLLDESAIDEFFVDLGGGAPPVSMVTAVLPFVAEPVETTVEAAAAQGFRGVLFGEGVQPRRLLQAVSISALDAVARQARARHLAVGFAGTMEHPDIPRLLALAPDVLVFDELVRETGPSPRPISPERIRFVRDLIPADAPAAVQAAPAPIGCDRIFVRDWTVSIPVGAYAHERAPQRARFTVEVALAPAVDRVADLRGVVTYDLITDAISRITARHVDLVETIAEDVAAAVLAHPRVVSVDMTVEKLDLGPGSLGCRIVRGRPA